jgi:histidine ammonia-lyase
VIPSGARRHSGGAIVLDGATLTPDGVVAVARGRARVQLAEQARERNAAARMAIEALVRAGGSLYGATTGVGALRDFAITDDDRESFQWNLLRSHAVSSGSPLAPETVRAGMVTRANQLGAGGAGVAPELLDLLVDALNRGMVPLTHELGSLGTGDLPELAEIALALLGEGQLRTPEGRILKAPGPRTPVRLGLRDGLGFMSSNALTAGRAALLLVDMRALLESWLTVAALSFEALGADSVVLDEQVQTARGMTGQTAVAGRMRDLLAGAGIEVGGGRRPIQDPYPFRVLPQVDGVLSDALRALEGVLGRELNARTENALIEGGRAWPNGNFDAVELGSVLDSLRGSMAHSASLIAARVSAFLDPRMTGLAAFLAPRPGLDSGVMMLEYTAQAAAVEVRSLAAPMATQGVWAALGVESHASLAATAARRAEQVLDPLRVLVAIELVVAMRALALIGRTPRGAGTRPLYEAAVRALPGGLEDRAFGRDVQSAISLLAELFAS